MSPGLIEVDGRLAILQPRHPGNPSLARLGISIWTLEESMVWTKQYYIRFPTPLLERISRPLFYNENVFFASNCVAGEIAVLVTWMRAMSILFYNLRTQSWRKFDIYDICSPICKPEAGMQFILDNVF